MQEEINKLILRVLHLQPKLNLTCECLTEEIEKRSFSETSKRKFAVQLKSVKKEHDALKNKRTSCLNKLSHLSTCNVNKRLITQKDNVQVLKEKLCNQEGQIGELEVKTKKLNKKLEEALKAGVKERKKRYYWKNLAQRIVSKNGNSSFSQSYVDDLNEQIMYLQNEKLQLEEKMQEFVANKVNFFHNGKYGNNICTVYQDLLCMRLST